MTDTNDTPKTPATSSGKPAVKARKGKAPAKAGQGKPPAKADRPPKPKAKHPKSLEAELIELRVNNRVAELGKRLVKEAKIDGSDPHKVKSAAFATLAIEAALDIHDPDQIIDMITEGGQDEGIDAMHIAEDADGKTVNVTVFQSKYSKKLTASDGFSTNELKKMAAIVDELRKRSGEIDANERVMKRVERLRAFQKKGKLARIHVVACNNGKGWEDDARRKVVDRSPDRVTWEHLGAQELADHKVFAKPVDLSLELVGKTLLEDHTKDRPTGKGNEKTEVKRRTLVGRVPAAKIAEMLEEAGPAILQRNIRQYLGQKDNKVNQEVARTLLDPTQQDDFYFLNNGIVMTCTALDCVEDEEDPILQLEGVQIINGGQTCRTIEEVVRENGAEAVGSASVMVRIHELPKADDKMVLRITHTTNSQSPVNWRDLRSNDPIQIRLEQQFAELGFRYRRQRSEEPLEEKDITPEEVAEAICSAELEIGPYFVFNEQVAFCEHYEEIFHEGIICQKLICMVYALRASQKLKTVNKIYSKFIGVPNFLSEIENFTAFEERFSNEKGHIDYSKLGKSAMEAIVQFFEVEKEGYEDFFKNNLEDIANKYFYIDESDLSKKEREKIFLEFFTEYENAIKKALLSPETDTPSQ